MGSTQVLPPLRRVVTTHNDQGIAVVESNIELPSKPMTIVKNARDAPLWITTEMPSKDNNSREDGRLRVIDDLTNFGLVSSTGTNLRSTELGPGAITPMHRTSSIDFNILVTGEITLITEDEKETHLTNAGDTVVQKGGMHAWRNPSPDKWARWVTVLIAAEPAVVHGNALKPAFVHD
jgi:hypothetical protein